MLKRLSIAALLIVAEILRADDARVDAILKDAVPDENGPGLAVLVMRDGKRVYSGTRGLGDVAGKQPITPKTTFELASCTKQFTGLATMLLLERSRLALDDDIRKHLPELPEYNKEKPVKIRHLLDHTSGIPEYLGLGIEPKGVVNNADMIGQLTAKFADHPQRFATGEKFEYSNSNYMLLAATVEKVSKKSFGTFARDEIFGPLGMKSAAFYERPDSKITQPALGYKLSKGKYDAIWGAPPLRNESLLTIGDGGAWCSLEDLEVYDSGFRAGKLLKDAGALAKHLKPGRVGNYNFGWIITLDKTGKLESLHHHGSWGGFNSAYYMDFSNATSIIVLTNRPGVDVGDIYEKVKRATR